MLYECTFWSYVKVNYILLREASISNTRNESVTASFKFTCKAMSDVVSQATPFAERGRVWSRCNYRVVNEERNY